MWIFFLSIPNQVSPLCSKVAGSHSQSHWARATLLTKLDGGGEDKAASVWSLNTTNSCSSYPKFSRFSWIQTLFAVWLFDFQSSESLFLTVLILVYIVAFWGEDLLTSSFCHTWSLSCLTGGFSLNMITFRIINNIAGFSIYFIGIWLLSVSVYLSSFPPFLPSLG